MIAARWRVVLAVGFVAVFFTNLANFSLRFGLPPLYWVAAFAALALPLLARDALPPRLPLDPLLVWSYGYLLVSVAGFFWSSQGALAWQQVQTRVLSVGFLLLGRYLFADAGARRAAGRAIVAATLLAAALNLYELFNPLTFSTIPGRSSGLYTNVGQSGAALVLGLIVGQAALPAGWRPAYAVAVGAGIVPTFARAAILGWGMVVGLSLLRRAERPRALLAAGAAGLAVAALVLTPLGGALEQELLARGVLTADVQERLSFFTEGEADDDSAAERRGVAALAWAAFADRPLAGGGTGASTEPPFVLQPHNMYLAMAVDHGVVGLAFLPTLLLASVWGAGRRTLPVVVPYAAFVALWGFFSHNILEERYILLVVAWVAAEVAACRTAPAEGDAA